jgi:glycerol-3-phosphate cytidylyltransferase
MFPHIEKLKKEGKIIGFTASTSDLAHPGFIDMLMQAKTQCDYLVFGLLTDPTISRPDKKNKPIETTFERWLRLNAIKYIDMIIPFDTEGDLNVMIRLIKPHVRFCGKEYEHDLEHTGRNIPDVKIIYNDRDHNWSSTLLRTRIYSAEQLKK